MASRLSLLAVFAHPDDETCAGGTLARYSAEGVKVSLVSATRGEAGEVGDPPLCSQEDLGAVREQELRQAAAVLGIDDPRFLGYADGELDSYDPSEVEGKIVKAIRELRPQVVITFGPEGCTAHPDHIAVHKLTTAAFQSAGEAGKYPEHFREGLSAHLPQKLYYVALPDQDLPITTTVDVSEYVESKARAVQSHKTQARVMSDPSPSSQEAVDEQPSNEYFHLAISRLVHREEEETDLFAGLLKPGQAMLSMKR